jgi:hypothetical protein
MDIFSATFPVSRDILVHNVRSAGVFQYKAFSQHGYASKTKKEQGRYSSAKYSVRPA